MSVLERNNTDFPIKSLTLLKRVKERYDKAKSDSSDPEHHWANVLKYYQYMVRYAMTDPEYGIGVNGNARGFLIYHVMGMGKTRLAVAVAMSMWDIRPVTIMLPKSLQKNFYNSVMSVIDLLYADDPDADIPAIKKHAERKFSFASMDAYNSAEQLKTGRKVSEQKTHDQLAKYSKSSTSGLDGKLLIVDEAHNFFRSIINSGSENSNGKKIYDMIMSAKNLRILFLTGTPAAKDPFELVPCFNMLMGKEILPSHYEIFNKFYIDTKNHTVLNPDKFANRIMGLVSHIGMQQTEMVAGQEGWFPRELPLKIEFVPMGKEQYNRYLLAREREGAENKQHTKVSTAAIQGKPLSLPGADSKSSRTYHVKSRTLATFAGPDIPVELMDDATFTEEIGPKLALIAKRALAAPGPILAYSQFVENGLKPLARYLQKLGFTEYEENILGSAEFNILGAAEVNKYIMKDNLLIPNSTMIKTALLWEFNNCTLIENIIRILPDKNFKIFSELKACIERWILAANNKKVITQYNQWGVYHNMLSDRDAINKFIDETKRYVRNNIQLLDDIIELIKSTIKTNPMPQIEAKLGDGVISIDINRTAIHYKYNKNLLRRAKENGLSEQDAVNALAIAILRYNTILSGSQQLGLLRSHTNKLYGIGVRNEAYASPFNSRFVNYEDGRFCSLFADSDSVFGSMGPFQQLDMLAYQGGWMVNPPYVESIIDTAGDIIIDAMGRAKADNPLLTFVLIPAWLDAHSIIKIIESKYTIASVLLNNFALEAPDGHIIQMVAKHGIFFLAMRSHPPSKDLLIHIKHVLDVDDNSLDKIVVRVTGSAEAPTSSNLRYAVISGDVSSERRDAIVSAFNSKENMHGEVIKAILVSKTGAEGLDLKWIRETHQIESYWDIARDKQVIARAVRLKSHDGLPEEEREVQPYLYLASPNQEVYANLTERNREPKTIDELFYDRAIERYKTISAFRDILSSVSIECELLNYGNCRICALTNSKLYSEDFALDIRLPDPCQCHKETEVEAKSIEVDGVKYYYKLEEGMPVIYEFNKELDGYTEIDSQSPLITKILKLLRF